MEGFTTRDRPLGPWWSRSWGVMPHCGRRSLFFCTADDNPKCQWKEVVKCCICKWGKEKEWCNRPGNQQLHSSSSSSLYSDLASLPLSVKLSVSHCRRVHIQLSGALGCCKKKNSKSEPGPFFPPREPSVKGEGSVSLCDLWRPWWSRTEWTVMVDFQNQCRREMKCFDGLGRLWPGDKCVRFRGRRTKCWVSSGGLRWMAGNGSERPVFLWVMRQD